MGPLDEVDIFSTAYGDDQRLTLRPLIRHAVNLDDILRCCYSRLWLDSLSVSDESSLGMDGMVETIQQDYDCRDMAGVLSSLLEKIEILGDLVRLTEKGCRRPAVSFGCSGENRRLKNCRLWEKKSIVSMSELNLYRMHSSRIKTHR